jgi:hypothetical protein
MSWQVGGGYHHDVQRSSASVAIPRLTAPGRSWMVWVSPSSRHSRYSTDRGNLAHRPTAELVAGFGQILIGCAALLRPGGVIAVTVRPFRVAGELVDLPGQVITTAEDNGLVLADRFAALLCGLRDGQIVTRASFFQMIEARRLREHGIPAMATAHEDLLLFQTRTESRPGGCR